MTDRELALGCELARVEGVLLAIARLCRNKHVSRELVAELAEETERNARTIRKPVPANAA